jgi:hypothetical protein
VTDYKGISLKRLWVWGPPRRDSAIDGVAGSLENVNF